MPKGMGSPFVQLSTRVNNPQRSARRLFREREFGFCRNKKIREGKLFDVPCDATAMMGGSMGVRWQIQQPPIVHIEKC